MTEEFPIWWGKAPRIISTFLESYDFTGKTIIPFCTSASSGIGSSAKNLHNLTNGAKWHDGRRFGGSASRSNVAAWAKNIDLDSAVIPEPEPKPDPEPAPEPGTSNILIAYFSRVGNTEYPDDVDATTSASIVVDDTEQYAKTDRNCGNQPTEGNSSTCRMRRLSANSMLKSGAYTIITASQGMCRCWINFTPL